MRSIMAFALVVGICAPLSACGSSARSSSPSSPKAVLASIVSAALAQKSVHWEELVRPHMERPIQYRADVTPDSGTRRIIFATGMHFTGKAQERLVNGVAYVEGDSVGLADALSLNEAQAKKYAGRWISIRRGDTLYSEIADGLTLESLIHDTIPAGRPLKLVRRSGRRTGILVIQVNVRSRNFAGLPGSLLAEARGEPLPVAFYRSNCVGCDDRGSFTSWNESVKVKAPASSIPIATVRRG